MRKNKLEKLVFASVFLALGMVLPLFTSQIKEIGDSLLPMHLMVLLCGAFCGWKYGFAVGMIMPYLRAVCFGMPPVYPNAVWMSFELAAYGFVIGFLYFKLPENKLYSIYLSLITAMVTGRIVWGISKAILFGISGKVFTIPMFIVGGITDAIPGIVLQLILVPAIVKAYEKRKK